MTQPPLTVVITRDLPSSFPRSDFQHRVQFKLAPTDEALRTAVRDASVLYSWQVPDNVPSESPRLRWIQLPSAGANHLLDQPVWHSDILITSAAGVHTVPMAEHLFALLLALTRQIPAIVRAQEQRDWLHSRAGERARLEELRGKTMGIVGWGKIGDGVAHLAGAFGMRVIGTRWSIIVPREIPRTATAYSNPPWLDPVDLPSDVVYPAARLHEVLADSDVVVLILPLTDETHRSFGNREFRAMKRGSLFLNIGRGPVVDEGALVTALQSGHLAGAGLDVFEQEPLPKSSPLWETPNVIVSPHVGGFSPRTTERAASLFVVNLHRYLDGQPLLNEVNRDQGY